MCRAHNVSAPDSRYRLVIALLSNHCTGASPPVATLRRRCLLDFFPLCPLSRPTISDYLFIDVRGQLRPFKLLFLSLKYFISTMPLPIPLSRWTSCYVMRPLPGPRFAGIIAVLLCLHMTRYNLTY